MLRTVIDPFAIVGSAACSAPSSNSLIVALGAGVYTGLGSMPQWRRANYDASYDALASHDLTHAIV